MDGVTYTTHLWLPVSGVSRGVFWLPGNPPPWPWFFLNQGVTLFTGTVLHQPLKCSTFGNPPPWDQLWIRHCPSYVCNRWASRRQTARQQQRCDGNIYLESRSSPQSEKPSATKSLKPRIVDIRDLPADDQPNNVQQVKNQKYIESRHRHGKMAANRGNAADHIQAIEHHFEEPDSHPFARCVIRGHQQIPAIIMYIDEQLSDIRRFCCSPPIGETTVLGVDKTFNLGQFQVTVTCFKNLSMLRRDTNDHPIFLGPMYIHGSSKTSDYSVFFDHIRSAMDNPRSSPTIGSDDEKALRTQ